MPNAAVNASGATRSFHLAGDRAVIARAQAPQLQPSPADSPAGDPFPTYNLQNFCHPLIGSLIQQLNTGSIAGMLDPDFLQSLASDFFTTDYQNISAIGEPYPMNEIDVSIGGPYANYNWELLFHLPVAVAVHLSQNQRFAEAQQWFHLVFDPTSTDMSVPEPQRYWKSFVFRAPGPGTITDIGSLLELLSTPDLQGPQLQQQQNVLEGYQAITANPFLPHLVAQTRPVAYQYYVVMKYLDNLIAWGDSLFANPTIETVNEATLCYVLAANLLGPRPQALPARGAATPMTYAQLRQNAELGTLDAMGNALVELETQFPFDLDVAGSQAIQSGPLFGIGRSLYFCVPRNPTLLGYWDTVADRLFKIRHCQNLQGIVQPLPLFDPPLNPGVLVQAAAAGIDVGSIVSGLNQPAGPIRSVTRIQKAIELCAGVKEFGAALLAAFEKGDAELLAQLRQNHELSLQQMTQNVRFLQYQQAQQATKSLLATRAVTLERYTFYLRALGLSPDPATVPDTFPVSQSEQTELTEDNFTAAYTSLVSAYDLTITAQPYPTLQLAQASSPSAQSGASGTGQLYLNTNESAELNVHMPLGRDERLASSVGDTVAATLVPIPNAEVKLHYWGIGGSITVPGGTTISEVAKLGAGVLRTLAGWQQDQGSMAARTAGYQRRTDDWVLQGNLAARELMQIGKQLLGSLIAEQVAYHEYTTTKAQVSQAQDVLNFLTGQAVAWPDGSNVTKLTTADLYGWMQGELTQLYYQYYRMALDAARKAEQTVKWELMRPEVDAVSYIQPNYWDSGRQGLLSGEGLGLDLKRLEADYLDNNKRELELTCNVSLRQLDPLALISLKVTGSCTVTIPEAYYDRTCPGHYLRRMKAMAVSIPAVTGPYTSVNCTLALQSSTVRVSSQLANGTYGRDPANPDPRFADYFGSVETMVTSGATNDSGMFETNLHDDRFLPFEGSGAAGTWSLSLPASLRPFDYTTISDVILHVRYTARDGGAALAAQATKELRAILSGASQSGLALLFSLRYDFPTEWSAFLNGSGDYTVALLTQYFPYLVQGINLAVDGVTVYDAKLSPSEPLTPADLASLADGLNSPAASAQLTLPGAAVTREPQADVWLVLSYHLQ